MQEFYINGEKCKEYIEKLKFLADNPVKDLSRLSGDAFTNWRVNEKRVDKK
jgi:hypothetical protein